MVEYNYRKNIQKTDIGESIMEKNGISRECAEMEEVINHIPDVISCKITMSGEDIEEIHVLAYNDRNAKQISRDIQSALAAKFTTRIDYKKISVAQVDFEQELGRSERIKINSIGYSMVGNIMETKVILQKGEEIIEGISKGTNSKNNVLRLVGAATIDCVHHLLNIRDTFTLEDIEKLQLAKQEIITVAISFITNHGEELLVGSAIVKKDDYETIVKATLDALNRVLIQANN